MTFLYLAAGAVLLILGRKLFWLFVGILGFLFGMTLAPQILPNQSQTVILVLALIIGVIGSVLAVLVQKVMIGLAGFMAGGYLVYALLPMLGLSLGSFLWVAIVVGGILGALLASSMFDWALVLLSSGVGASMITKELSLPQPLGLVLLVALIIVGIIIQGNIKSKE